MSDVIEFTFTQLLNIWDLITSSWLLSMAFLITIIGFIVTLINGSNGNN